jgi:hypothetical protein
LATKEQKPSRAMALVNGFKYRHTSHVYIIMRLRLYQLYLYTVCIFSKIL